MRARPLSTQTQTIDLPRQSHRFPLATNGNTCPGESVEESLAKSAVYAHSSPVGTHPAVIDNIPSGTAFSEEAHRRGWGGARNSTDRTSESLTENECLKIIAAAQFAVRVGLPLNRHVTIHWEQAGIADERAAWATGRFLKLAGDWLAKRANLKNNQTKSSRLAWAWVRENGDSKGSHVHILLHCPPELARSFSAMQRRWLGRISGERYRTRTIRTARIGGTLNAANSMPAAYSENLANVVGYVLKGASSDAAVRLGLSRLESGGRVIGKRAATSENLGLAAHHKRLGNTGAARLPAVF